MINSMPPCLHLASPCSTCPGWDDAHGSLVKDVGFGKLSKASASRKYTYVKFSSGKNGVVLPGSSPGLWSLSTWNVIFWLSFTLCQYELLKPSSLKLSFFHGLFYMSLGLIYSPWQAWICSATPGPIWRTRISCQHLCGWNSTLFTVPL